MTDEYRKKASFDVEQMRTIFDDEIVQNYRVKTKQKSQKFSILLSRIHFGQN